MNLLAAREKSLGEQSHSGETILCGVLKQFLYTANNCKCTLCPIK